MENHTPQTFALKVKIHYSDRNIQKLTERFLRFEGVDEVEVEAEHELVIITGTVDPQMLINYLESKDVEAGIHTVHDSESDVSPEKPNGGGTGEQGKKREKEKKKKKRSRKPKEEEEDDHVCEAYQALKIDPLICMDLYCKTHKSRATINNKVPSINSEDHPRHNQHGHDHGFSFGNNAPMFGGGPFPYPGPDRTPMMMQAPMGNYMPGFPPGRNYMPAYGFPPGRNYMPGFGNARRPFMWY